jgi:probable F420-dependent oxidoreductase
MKFGLFGGARAARGGPTGDSHGYGEFIAYVVEAERLGFRSVFLVEHHFTGHAQVSASLNLLSYLAACTKRIRLGTAVVVLPWHNPVLVAEQAATLDLLSNGRLDFGVGKGYRDSEFSGFCIPIAESTERFDEAIEVIRKAWTSEGRFSHHGKRWNFEDIVIEPPPVQKPHPPFLFGGESEAALRRAAALGDGWYGVGHTPQTAGPRVCELRGLLETIGRSGDRFEITVSHAAPGIDRATVDRYREAGVDRVVVLPWTRGRDAESGVRALAETLGLRSG